MDFLFENPFIIVVLLGILSSLFKKKKGDTQSTNESEKPFVESAERDIIEDYYRELEPVKPQEPIKNIQAEFRDSRKEAAAKIAALKEQQKKYAKQAERMNGPGRLNPGSTREPVTSGASATFKVDQEKLADAVIWSEILGPPRSKKPHRSRNIR